MKFSTISVQENFSKMLPRTRELAMEMDKWAQDTFKIELTLTETATTKQQDDLLKRVSATHREGRAFDVRVRGLPDALIAQLCAFFRKKYKNLGAVSLSTRSRELIVYKPHGTGAHLHVQIKRGA